MKFSHPVVQKFIGLSACTLIRRWMTTLDYRVAYYDPATDPARPEFNDEPAIYVFWHEYMVFPLHMRGHCNLAFLLSRHRDADVLSRVARHMGFEFVRGSTSRGGASALRELSRRGRHMHLAITPDGPRGPRRKLALGPVYLSSKLGRPLVVLAFGYDRPWRLGSWDRFAIPRPFSRARAVVGPQMWIPPNLDREGLEHYRLEVQLQLNRLTQEAEDWAHSGVRKPEETILRRETNRRLARRAA